MEQAVGWDCRGQGLQNPFACFACSRALESHAGNCLQLCRRDLYPSAVGWRGRPGSLRLFLPFPSQLCPFSLSLSFSLQKAWVFIPGQKKITCSHASEESGSLSPRHELTLLQCDYHKGEFCERFFPSPKRCFHIFSLFPHRFSLSVHGLL